MQLKQFLEELKQLQDPVRAAKDKAYHKSSREHWGIPVPVCEALTKRLTQGLDELALLRLAGDLWATDLFDPMVCGAKILNLTRLKPSKALWLAIVEFLKKVDGWALEDHMAVKAGKCILADPLLLDQLETWTRHPNFWMRRAVLVYTLPFAKAGRDPERMLKWASLYATDSEWFIQKAIGWWLRVLGEHNPKRVWEFLEEHGGKLKSVARREATRKLVKELVM